MEVQGYFPPPVWRHSSLVEWATISDKFTHLFLNIIADIDIMFCVYPRQGKGNLCFDGLFFFDLSNDHSLRSFGRRVKKALSRKHNYCKVAEPLLRLLCNSSIGMQLRELNVTKTKSSSQLYISNNYMHKLYWVICLWIISTHIRI